MLVGADTMSVNSFLKKIFITATLPIISITGSKDHITFGISIVEANINCYLLNEKLYRFNVEVLWHITNKHTAIQVLFRLMQKVFLSVFEF